jgi:hypothetical protein
MYILGNKATLEANASNTPMWSEVREGHDLLWYRAHENKRAHEKKCVHMNEQARR